MELFLFWFLWLLAIAFDVLVIGLLGYMICKGKMEKLHYFHEYTEEDEESIFLLEK